MSSFALPVRASDKETLAAVLKFLISMYRELSSPLSLTFVARVLEESSRMADDLRQGSVMCRLKKQRINRAMRRR
jgi:hypothetical protein